MTYYLTPYRRMAAIRRAMNDWYDHSWAERELPLAVDVRSGEEAYEVTAFVPGLEADKLDIEVLNDVVTIRGEFPGYDGAEAEHVLSELPSGKFSRMITLPTVADAEHVEASIKNGVLSLHIPKAEIDRPKAIKVTTMN